MSRSQIKHQFKKKMLTKYVLKIKHLYIYLCLILVEFIVKCDRAHISNYLFKKTL